MAYLFELLVSTLKIIAEALLDWRARHPDYGRTIESTPQAEDQFVTAVEAVRSGSSSPS